MWSGMISEDFTHTFFVSFFKKKCFIYLFWLMGTLTEHRYWGAKSTQVHKIFIIQISWLFFWRWYIQDRVCIITYRELWTHGSYVTGLWGQMLPEVACNTNSSRKHYSLWEKSYRNHTLRGQEVRYRYAVGTECTSPKTREKIIYLDTIATSSKSSLRIDSSIFWLGNFT